MKPLIVLLLVPLPWIICHWQYTLLHINFQQKFPFQVPQRSCIFQVNFFLLKFVHFLASYKTTNSEIIL
jgi:hypothetical protein